MKRIVLVAALLLGGAMTAQADTTHWTAVHPPHSDAQLAAGHPEIAGDASAGVGLYDPRSADGRPLTAAAGVRKSRVGDR